MAIRVSSFLGLFSVASAQNLVSNGSFEHFSQCPPYLGQIHLANFWDSPNNNTTDFFHRCSPPVDGAGVPLNELGTQAPADGEGYAGVRLWVPNIPGNPVYREYLGIRLNSPLEGGKRYFARFKVCLAENSTFATDGLGMWLSDSPFPNERLYEVLPQITNPPGKVLEDTFEWTEISGIFTAQGGEEYLMIGNFQSNEEMYRIAVHQNYGPVVYYYVDDVVLSACSENAEMSDQVDTVLCAGVPLRLDAPPGTAYWWNDGSTLPFLMVDQPGTWTVTASSGCTSFTRTFTVTEVDCSCLIAFSQSVLHLGSRVELLEWKVFDIAGRLLERSGEIPDFTLYQTGFYLFYAKYRCNGVEKQTVKWVWLSA